MSINSMNLRHKTKSIIRDTQGQGLVEYALILLLIAVVVVLAVSYLGSTTSSAFSAANSSIK
jgi:pilus assembly protein Flp/PilA